VPKLDIGVQSIDSASTSLLGLIDAVRDQVETIDLPANSTDPYQNLRVLKAAADLFLLQREKLIALSSAIASPSILALAGADSLTDAQKTTLRELIGFNSVIVAEVDQAVNKATAATVVDEVDESIRAILENLTMCEIKLSGISPDDENYAAALSQQQSLKLCIESLMPTNSV
jgi:hypothetical protein